MSTGMSAVPNQPMASISETDTSTGCRTRSAVVSSPPAKTCARAAGHGGEEDEQGSREAGKQGSREAGKQGKDLRPRGPR